MKASLLLAGAAAATLSLASCSSNTTESTTATTTMPADTTAMATTTTTRTYSDADYHTRGDRMATKFASANNISDEATMSKLKTAYYNRSKRYDEMMTKYQSDTTGMGQAKRDYMMANDQEFKTALPAAQYQSYQSSYTSPDYDESSNMDIQGQSAAASSATMPSDNGNMSSGSNMNNNSDVNNGSTMNDGSNMSGNGNGNMPTTAGKVMRQEGMMDGSNTVEKSKTKLENGAKVKVKDGDVKVKTADGEKMKM